MTLDYTGVGHGASVTFSLANDPLGNPFTDFAGEIRWRQINGNGTYGPDFSAFCVDATRYLTDPETVDVRSTNDLTGTTQSNGAVVAGGGADAGKRIAWLVNSFGSVAHTDVTGVAAAALQVAIWETLYDGVANLAGGSFRLLTTGAVNSTASSYLAQLYSKPLVGGGTTYYTSEAIWLDTTNGQDQVRSVPEPGSILLVGVGAATALMRRRNRSASLAS